MSKPFCRTGRRSDDSTYVWCKGGAPKPKTTEDTKKKAVDAVVVKFSKEAITKTLNRAEAQIKQDVAGGMSLQQSLNRNMTLGDRLRSMGGVVPQPSVEDMTLGARLRSMRKAVPDRSVEDATPQERIALTAEDKGKAPMSIKEAVREVVVQEACGSGLTPEERRETPVLMDHLTPVETCVKECAPPVLKPPEPVEQPKPTLLPFKAELDEAETKAQTKEERDKQMERFKRLRPEGALEGTYSTETHRVKPATAGRVGLNDDKNDPHLDRHGFKLFVGDYVSMGVRNKEELRERYEGNLRSIERSKKKGEEPRITPYHATDVALDKKTEKTGVFGQVVSFLKDRKVKVRTMGTQAGFTQEFMTYQAFNFTIITKEDYDFFLGRAIRRHESGKVYDYAPSWLKDGREDAEKLKKRKDEGEYVALKAEPDPSKFELFTPERIKNPDPRHYVRKRQAGAEYFRLKGTTRVGLVIEARGKSKHLVSFYKEKPFEIDNAEMEFMRRKK